MEVKKIGVIGASSIVAGNMMGSGISLLPASLASVGSITVISWAITLIGALSLAYVFSRLGLLDPKEGGPVAYAKELSGILGHQTGLLYWLVNWIGNLAIAITGVEYLSYFFHPLKEPIVAGLCVIALIWFFTVINIYGASKIAKIISVTLVLLLIPVVGTAIFGWSHFSKDQFIQNWNVSAHSDTHAIFAGIVLTIWSFIGIESASVGAGLVKNPKVTVPLATMIGTCVAGIVYIGSTTVISGMFPAHEMAISGEPFGKSFGLIVGSWVQPIVSICTAIACFASLGGWMMLVGQAGMVAAKQETLPELFRRVNSRGLPAQGLIVTGILMTAFMVILMLANNVDRASSTGMFNYIISTAVVITVIPYFYSSLHLITIDTGGTKEKFRLVIPLVAAVFCFTAFAGSSKTELVGTIIASFVCFLFYCLKIRKKGTSRENYFNHTTWR